MARQKTLILHLARASARRANVDKLLAHPLLDGAVFDAVDAREMPQPERDAHLTPTAFAPPYPFPLKAGEIGCFLSHKGMWDQIIAQGGPVLILEDDVILGPGFADALSLAQNHIEAFPFIQLQTRPSSGPVLHQSGAAALRQPDITQLRTTAQLVAPAAARQLLERCATFDRPIDTFLQSHWHTGLKIAAISPSGISEDGDAMGGSTIQSSARRSALQSLQREWRRFTYRRAVQKAARRGPQ